ADGRFVAFQSAAGNLVEGTDNFQWDIFVHDRLTGVTTLESLTSAGRPGASGPGDFRFHGSMHPRISADGRYVLFDSDARNFPGHEYCGVDRCFRALLHDRLTGSTTLAARGSGGAAANGPSFMAALTPDGRSVLFASPATSLPGANGFWQLYLHDRVTGVTHLVSAATDGSAGLMDTGQVGTAPSAMEFPVTTAALSDDGRFASFISAAPNLVQQDTNGGLDTFVHDVKTGVTTRVSVTSTGKQGTADAVAEKDLVARATSISGDGRYIAFDSGSSDLVPGDTNQQPDVFVHDRLTRTTVRVSVSSVGAQRSERSFFPAMAGDGSVVVFASDQTGPLFGAKSVFVHVIPQLLP
ncbi:MAG: hypothetical protein M3P04_01260, partial [Actinomycetota bacterium]|nr:hypothetical protein [Actinomycetota bacterium]